MAMQGPATEEADLPASWIPVASPLMGIFYLTETPQSAPYVTVGMTILEGQVVGLIESMKMYNPVESDVSGIVRAILITNGSLVEKGQPLIYVESLGDAG
jgi:acetyl-CoA carboxylase biotin carboxyl carrier protein